MGDLLLERLATRKAISNSEDQFRKVPYDAKTCNHCSTRPPSFQPLIHATQSREDVVTVHTCLTSDTQLICHDIHHQLATCVRSSALRFRERRGSHKPDLGSTGSPKHVSRVMIRTPKASKKAKKTYESLSVLICRCPSSSKNCFSSGALMRLPLFHVNLM